MASIKCVIRGCLLIHYWDGGRLDFCRSLVSGVLFPSGLFHKQLLESNLGWRGIKITFIVKCFIPDKKMKLCVFPY